MMDLQGPKGKIRTTYGVFSDPYGAYRRWTKAYGDTFLIHAFNGDVVCSSNRGFVKDFFRLTDDEHHPFAVEAIAPLVGKGSLLLLSGRRHKEERRLLMPAFHGERMRAYTQTILKITADQIDQLEGEVNARDKMLTISLEVIIRAVFGAEQKEQIEAFHHAIREQVSAANPVFLFASFLQRPFFGLSPWDRFVRARTHLRELLTKEVRQVKQGDDSRTDILALLAGARYEDGREMEEEAIVDELVTLLFAGHETTQIALSWALYWLYRQPDTLRRLREELAALDGDLNAISRAPYLEGVVYEALRLNTIVPDVLRTLTVSKELGGRQYPAGTNVAVLSSLIHEDPELFPEPHQFRPERWASDPPKWAFLPFGGGVRRCIGASLAMYEMKIVISEVVRRVDFEVLGEEVAKRASLVIGPAQGVRLRVLEVRA